MYYRILLPLLFILQVLTIPTSYATPCNEIQSSHRIIEVSDTEAKVLVFRNPQKKSVKFSNIKINQEKLASMECYIFSGDVDPKLQLIKNEIADIIDLDIEESKYLDAYKKTKRYVDLFDESGKRRPIPLSKLSKSNSEPSEKKKNNPLKSWGTNISNILKSVWRFAIEYWTLLFGGGVVVILFRYIKKLRRERNLKICLIGMPASGKSSVTEAFTDNPNRSTLDDMKPTSSINLKQLSRSLDSSMSYKFSTMVADPRGTDPGEILKHMRKRWIFKRQNPMVIMLILSPTALDQKQSAQNIWDPIFMKEQLVYVTSSLSFVFRSPKVKKPMCIAVFVNKLDLYLSSPPDSNETKRAYAKLQDCMEVIDGWAAKKSIPVVKLAGSAKKEWNVRTAKERIIDAVARA